MAGESAPVKELEGRSVESIRPAKMALKDCKLLEGYEAASVLAQVKDAPIQAEGLPVVELLRQQPQELDQEVLIGQEQLSALTHACVL